MAATERVVLTVLANKKAVSCSFLSGNDSWMPLLWRTDIRPVHGRRYRATWTCSLVFDIGCHSRYWQIKIDEISQERKSFVRHNGLYRYTYTPMDCRMWQPLFSRTWMLSWHQWSSSLIWFTLKMLLLYYSTWKSTSNKEVRFILCTPRWFEIEAEELFLAIRLALRPFHHAALARGGIQSTIPYMVWHFDLPNDESKLLSYLGLCNV